MSAVISTDSHRNGRITLLIMVGAQAIGIGVIIALLAEIQDRFGYPTWTLGLIAGVSFATAFAAHIVLAPLADRGWERRLIMASAVLTIGSLVWMAGASELWHWVVARGILGIAEGAMTSSARRVMLGWNPEDQGKALSSLLAALLAGFLLGPPLGALLNEIGDAIPFLAPAVVVLLVIPFLTQIRPEPMGERKVRMRRLQLIRLPGVTEGVILVSADWLLIGVFDAIWAKYMSDLGASTLTIGLGFVVLVLPSVVFTPHGGRLADRINPIRIAVVAGLVQVPMIAAYGLVNSVTLLLAVAVCHSVAWSYMMPPALAAVAKVSPPAQAAESQGVVEAFGLIFAGIGAIVAAPLYGAHGPTWLFASAAVVMLFAVASVLRLRYRWVGAFGGLEST